MDTAAPGDPAHTEVHIQVGAYTDPQNAARMKQQISEFYTAHILGAMVNDQQFYRVRLGPFPTKQAASVVHAQLVDAGYSSARITVDKFIR